MLAIRIVAVLHQIGDNHPSAHLEFGRDGSQKTVERNDSALPGEESGIPQQLQPELPFNKLGQ